MIEQVVKVVESFGYTGALLIVSITANILLIRAVVKAYKQYELISQHRLNDIDRALRLAERAKSILRENGDSNEE